MSIDNLLTLCITIAPLIACAVILVRRERAAMKAMGASDHFQVKGFEANIDRVRNEVHIHIDGHRTFRAPLGHLVVEHKVETIAVAHEKKPKRFWDRIALPPSPRRLLRTGYLVAQSHVWAETVWTAVETGKTWVKLRAVRLPAYYAQHWAGWEEGQTGDTTDRVDVPLSNARALAFKSWLDHHQRSSFPTK